MKKVVVECSGCYGTGIENGGFICHFCGGNGGHVVPVGQINFDLVDVTRISVAGEILSVRFKGTNPKRRN